MTITHPKDIEIKDFDYPLPEARIARYPLPERDASKLLVFRNGHLQEDHFFHLPKYIPEKSLVIFNETKVVHARLLFHKATGARIEVFCLEPDISYATVEVAMTTKGSVLWKCMLGGASKWKDEDESIVLEVPEHNLKVQARKERKEGGTFILQLSWCSMDGQSDREKAGLSFAEILHLAGKVPLPPYLNREAEKSDEERYQTIFAREEGSVAAPTAALHFTDRVMDAFALKGIHTGFVTLHVGAGTFKPVKSDTMEGHEMHAEWIEADKKLVKSVVDQKNSGHPLIAVGTTSARTLESLYWIGVRILRLENIQLHDITVSQWYPYEHPADFSAARAFEAVLDYMEKHDIEKLVTRTQIIIAPGYAYRVLDALVTNFHQPQSTLMLLVAALIGDNWHQVYGFALAHDFRFLSYGDSSLLWKA